MRDKLFRMFGMVWIVLSTSEMCIGDDSMQEWIVDGKKLGLTTSSEAFTGKAFVLNIGKPNDAFEMKYERLTYSLAMKGDSGNHRVLWKTEFIRALDPGLNPVGYEIRVFDVARRADKLFVLYAKPNVILLDIVSMDEQDQEIQSFTLLDKNHSTGPIGHGGRLLLTGLGANALLDAGNGRLDLWTVRKGSSYHTTQLGLQALQ